MQEPAEGPKERREAHKRRIYAQSLLCEINPTAFQHKRHVYCAGYVHRYCTEESRTGGVHTEKQRHAYMAEEQRSRSEGITGGSEKGKNAPSLHPLLLFPHRCGIIVKAVALRARLSLCLRKEMPCVMLTEPIPCVIG